MKQAKGDDSLAKRASRTLLETLEHAFDGTIDAVSAKTSLQRVVPEEPRSDLIAVLERDTTPTRSYRVAALIQLAYGIAATELLDLAVRHPGARGQKGVAGDCGRYLKQKHVTAPPDAYQNIAKNTTDLARGNFPAFDRFLKWASTVDRETGALEACLEFAALKIAQTARPVLPFPEVIQAKLTFAAVMQLFQELLNAPSGGAHQQFLTAALLHARLEQAAKLEQEGGKQRVETKNINASDLSTRSAADIQIKIGSRTIEAYEVTANDWSTKLEQAIPTMKTHDLSRLHILARVDDFPEMLIELKKLNEDVSAIDILAFIAVLTSDLRREFRLVALRRLYGLLDREQPNIDLVNQYVQKLYVHGLVNAPPA